MIDLFTSRLPARHRFKNQPGIWDEEVAGWFQTKEMDILKRFKLPATSICTYWQRKWLIYLPFFWEEKPKFLVYIETKHDETVSKLYTNAKTYISLENVHKNY